MPTIESSYKDLCKLVGKKLDLKKLEREFISYVKGEVDEIDGDTLKFDMADTNRPDLWSTEGIARELKGYLSLDKGIPKYKAKKSSFKIKVDPKLKNIRPFIAAAVIKNIKVTEDLLIQMIQLQEKVTDTFGSKRKTAAIGLYDFDMITPPLHYKAADPEKEKFIPLEFKEPLTLRKILSKHPKGREYGHLLEGFNKYPLLIDSAGQVASMPPVINSNKTGKVTEETKNLFVEVTGQDWEHVHAAMLVMALALTDRGGILELVEIDYGKSKKLSPDLTPRKLKFNKSWISRLIDANLSDSKIKELLERARYGVKITKDKIEVEYLAYRQDIMHPADVVEDLIVAYGFDNIEPENPNLVVEGKLLKSEVLSNYFAETLIGLGAQEILSYTLTNKEFLFKNMNLEPGKVIELDNPVSKNWSVFRSWILPCLMEFLSRNTNQEYPQQIFEIGQVVLPDSKAETKSINPSMLSWAKIDKDISFTDAKQALEFLLDNYGIKATMETIKHDSFIEGRVAKIMLGKKQIGVVGEIHPQVLSNWSLEMPVAAFELNLEEIFKVVDYGS